MGCGCKNKSNGQTQQVQAQKSSPQQQGGNTSEIKQNVQENVKKIISKYYRR